MFTNPCLSYRLNFHQYLNDWSMFSRSLFSVNIVWSSINVERKCLSYKNNEYLKNGVVMGYLFPIMLFVGMSQMAFWVCHF